MGLLGGSSGIGAGFHGYGDPTKGFNPAKGLHDIIGRPKGPNVSNPLGGLMGGGGGGGGGSSSSYSPIDPNSIAKPQYTAANVSPISVGQMSSQLDVSGINALKANALAAPGESPWLKMATEQQRLGEVNDLGMASRAAAGQAAGAQAGLAMRGGLRGGAAERLAAQGAEQGLLAQQDVRNKGALGRLGLGMEAENMRRGDIQGLIGAQMGQASYLSDLDRGNIANKFGADTFNTQTAMQQAGLKTDFDKYLYGQQMQGLGAQNTANAIAAGGAGGAGGGDTWQSMLPGYSQTKPLLGKLGMG